MTDLLIVDDHEIVRAGIKRLFENTPNLNIVADLGSGEEAYQFLHKNTVDLIIMDVSMPGKGGIETTNQIKKRYPKIKISNSLLFKSLISESLNSSTSTDAEIIVSLFMTFSTAFSKSSDRSFFKI